MTAGAIAEVPRDPERALRRITVGVGLLERRLARPRPETPGRDDDLLMVTLAMSLERLAGEANASAVTPEQRARLGDAARRIRAVMDELAEREQRRLVAVAPGAPLPLPAPAPVPSPAGGVRMAAWSPGRVRTAVGALLLALGLGIALFLAFEFGITGALQARSQSSLLAQFRQRLHVGAFDAPGAPVEPGAVAVLRIPAIGLDEVVVQGSGTDALKQGPGHVPGTPLPGEYGNVVVIGHRLTYGGPFAGLHLLTPGDRITVLTGQGRFTYGVSGVRVVRPGQRDVTGPSADSRLTLVTSTSAFSGDRLAVIADLLGPPVGVPRRAPADVSQDELGTTGDPSGAFVALLVLQVLVVALFVAARLYRRWPPAAAYAVTTPVIAALLWIAFENLDRFLPGAL